MVEETKTDSVSGRGPISGIINLFRKLNEPQYALVVASVFWGVLQLTQGSKRMKGTDSKSGLPKDISRAPAPKIRKALRGEMSEPEMLDLLYRMNHGSLAHELYPDQYPDLVEMWKPQ